MTLQPLSPSLIIDEVARLGGCVFLTDDCSSVRLTWPPNVPLDDRIPREVAINRRGLVTELLRRAESDNDVRQNRPAIALDISGWVAGWISSVRSPDEPDNWDRRVAAGVGRQLLEVEQSGILPSATVRLLLARFDHACELRDIRQVEILGEDLSRLMSTAREGSRLGRSLGRAASRDGEGPFLIGLLSGNEGA
jgi:hypothetical protein